MQYIERGERCRQLAPTQQRHIWRLRCVRVAAWVLWVSVHFVALIGLRNRLLVLISWAWDYLFYEAAVRSMLLKAVWV